MCVYSRIMVWVYASSGVKVLGFSGYMVWFIRINPFVADCGIKCYIHVLGLSMCSVVAANCRVYRAAVCVSCEPVCVLRVCVRFRCCVYKNWCVFVDVHSCGSGYRVYGGVCMLDNLWKYYKTIAIVSVNNRTNKTNKEAGTEKPEKNLSLVRDCLLKAYLSSSYV